MDLEARLPHAALIVGCGDIGRRVARRLRALGREVTGVVRSAQSAAALEREGVAARAIDLDAGETETRTRDLPLVFYFAPPPAGGTTDPRLRRFLDTLAAPPQRLVYISTSGVYGDCQGRWVDEDEPLKPASERAHRRLDAERALYDYATRTGAEILILRVPGIYGPGRLPLERLHQGQPVIRPQESPYSNRIHADDLARAAVHAAAFGRSGAAYNISDGQPTTMADYFTRCALHLGLPPPPQVSIDEARRLFTPAMWSFMEESKRLRVERLRAELRFTPAYPDLDAGLRAIAPASSVPA